MSFRLGKKKDKGKDKEKDEGSSSKKKKGLGSLFGRNKSDKKGKKEKKSIHQLCVESDFEELRRLLKDVSVDINEVDDNGRSPLHLCTEPSCASLLLALSADINIKDTQFERNALQTFCALPRDKQDVAVAFLNDCKEDYDIDAFDGTKNTALHLACVRGQIKTVHGLIAHGADCNILNGDGNTPLHAVLLAIQSGEAAKQESLTIANVICSADPTSLFTKNTSGDYPINLAYKMHDDNLLKLLSTEMQKASSHDGTPGPLLENLSTELAYMLSEALLEGRLEVAETLLLAQISFCVEVENIGTTALHYACQNSLEDIALLMLRQPESLNVSAISKKDSSGNTALHFAAAANSYNLVAELLNMDCPSYAKNQAGLTALHVAVDNNSAEAVEVILELNRFEIARTGTKKNLHSKKTKGLINSQDKSKKRTPLHLACENQNAEIVQSLLWHKADPMVEDKSGSLPFELCDEAFAIELSQYAAEVEDRSFVHVDYLVIVDYDSDDDVPQQDDGDDVEEVAVDDEDVAAEAEGEAVQGEAAGPSGDADDAAEPTEDGAG